MRGRKVRDEEGDKGGERALFYCGGKAIGRRGL